MIVIADTRSLVREAYEQSFTQAGLPTMGMEPDAFMHWARHLEASTRADLSACLVSDIDFADRTDALEAVRSRLDTVPLIVLAERPSLENTLNFFSARVDDVIRKPAHAREILARAHAIRARGRQRDDGVSDGRLSVFQDGRDPVLDGETFTLPRRERRVLEHLASIGGRRATKEQLYVAIYGPFSDTVEETVVESHVSKLRKKLRAALGYDPIDSRRFLGYRLVLRADETSIALAA